MKVNRSGDTLMAETPELIQQYSNLVSNGDGAEYTVQSWARKTSQGQWEGWLEYHPLEDTRAVKKTAPVTSQPGRRDLTHWAAALGHSYLEAAFDRAK